jgi:hypothetical protein
MALNGAHWVVTVPQTWHNGSLTRNEYRKNASREQEEIRALLVSALLVPASSDDPQQIQHVSALLWLSKVNRRASLVRQLIVMARCSKDGQDLPYFPAYKTHRPIRHTVIFSLGILEKKWWMYFNLAIYWKKTGLLHILLQESKPFTSSDARFHDLEANFTISR